MDPPPTDADGRKSPIAGFGTMCALFAMIIVRLYNFNVDNRGNPGSFGNSGLKSLITISISLRKRKVISRIMKNTYNNVYI